MAVLSLAAWTLLTWVGRLPLLWGGQGQSRSEKLWGTVPVVIFVALAGVTLGQALRTGTSRRRVGYWLAGWSIAYWLVRLPMILLHHHPAGFKAVHAVLASVAVVLSIWALRSPAGLRTETSRTDGRAAPRFRSARS